MYLVREYLGDSYVIDADVYLNRNFLDKNITNSTYFSGYKKDFKNEWIIDYDSNGKVNDIVVGDGEGYILSGISYWSKEDASIIVNKLEEIIKFGDFDNLYWDDVVRNNLSSLNVYLRKIESDDSFEIDSLEELNDLNKFLNSIK